MVDETCWFMVCPSSKQRSDGEKVISVLKRCIASISPWVNKECNYPGPLFSRGIERGIIINLRWIKCLIEAYLNQRNVICAASYILLRVCGLLCALVYTRNYTTYVFLKLHILWYVQVRAGDDIFLRNVSNERYLSAQLSYLQNVESDTQKVRCCVQLCSG